METHAVPVGRKIGGGLWSPASSESVRRAAGGTKARIDAGLAAAGRARRHRCGLVVVIRDTCIAERPSRTKAQLHGAQTRFQALANLSSGVSRHAMYRWIDSTVIFLDRPSRNESNSFAASSSYRR